MSSTDERSWFRSSSSGSDGDVCIEVVRRAGTVHVRDSRDRLSPELAVTHTAWEYLVTFDRLG
ncbi:hypothetical protein GCM10023347_30300 [Streptomyces chumphonensis]|uniref:DUF397 domain-containing protein n=1 Tax=Streptomyces chumphonensis TaxID=1214925 RepID=A0A927F124_9ACTN|nr:DUF397 domain-containing protein [Streptomyces chumphonensis]MBD3933670.1 DUF397 domain-containing protein [Streptomyces chumphonensis]